MPVRRTAAPAAKPPAAPKPAKPAKPRAAKPAGGASKPKRQTKRQKADAYLERIKNIGAGRTGLKAKRAAKVQARAMYFASLLASFGKPAKKGLTGVELSKEKLASAFSNPKTIKSTAKNLKKAIKRAPLSGPKQFTRTGQTQRAKRRLNARISQVSIGSTNSTNPTRISASRQVVQRASAWYSGQRPTTRPGPVSKPAPVRPLLPARPDAPKPATAKSQSKKANPVKKAKKRFAKQRTAIQERSDYGAKRRVFQRKVIGVQTSLIGRPKPVFSGPRQIGTLSKYRGKFTPSASRSRR